MSDADAPLKPGDPHYRAYVGPPKQYDFMGATQFRLLTALGLREWHHVLDLGCGSLRAGRYLMTYLEPGHYCGIEPNGWLIQEAIAKDLSQGFVDLRAPRFDHNDRFDAGVFDTAFDYIVAQSIFSHTGPDMVTQALTSAAAALADRGLVLATFIHSDDAPDMPVEAPGWTYPGCTTYAPARVLELAGEAGLVGRALPWFHPRQTWYMLARQAVHVPHRDQDRHLIGAILRSPQFIDSRDILRPKEPS